METTKFKLSLIIPFFNEEKSVPVFFERIAEVFSATEARYTLELLCVNDGSSDGTFAALVSAQKKNSSMRIIDFSRNFGKEAAVTAGLDFATGDAVVPIDADLQHPPEVILEMLQKWEEGFEVVLARRVDRDTDRAAQRLSARAFYSLSRYITEVEIPADVGDFRLMDRKVVDAIRTMREQCRFMKGIFAWVGFRTTVINYKVDAREHGESKFNTWKLWNFALEGITSFSTVPLRVWTYIGGCVSGLAFLYAIYLIIKTLVFGVDAPGYASLMVVLLFSTGIQLVGIGILGEYLGRVFAEVKGAPSLYC